AEMVNVEDRVQFIQDDLLTVDFSDATVVTLYLLPSLNVKLKARILTELKPGARIIAHAFNMGRWQPDAKRAMGGVYLYKWVVPAPLQGTWEWLTDSGKVYRVALEIGRASCRESGAVGAAARCLEQPDTRGAL